VRTGQLSHWRPRARAALAAARRSGSTRRNSDLQQAGTAARALPVSAVRQEGVGVGDITKSQLRQHKEAIDEVEAAPTPLSNAMGRAFSPGPTQAQMADGDMRHL
jgi:hypothetical protein